MKRISQVVAGWGVLWALILGLAPAAEAQIELEPNDTCGTAQVFGEFTRPFRLDGFLEMDPSAPGPSPVDPQFVKLEADFVMLFADPGSELIVEVLRKRRLTGIPLKDPILSVFNARCELLAMNDDASLGAFTVIDSQSRVDLVVPDDGVFVVGVNGRGPDRAGYRILIRDRPRPFGSIRGRLVDASTGSTLGGIVSLVECVRAGCFEVAKNLSIGTAGEFVFTPDRGAADMLRAGRYTIDVAVHMGEPVRQVFGPFEIAEDEVLDLGDLLITAPSMLMTPSVPPAEPEPAPPIPMPTMDPPTGDGVCPPVDLPTGVVPLTGLTEP